MTVPQDTAPGVAPDPGPRPPLRRTPRQKAVAGVCGGLGRYCDVDPVIFRIVIGVLAVTGGIGLIFYGFAWLLLPLEGEEENEARKLLSGRVEGASLVALLFALVGCGLLLSMLHNGGMLAFAAMLSLAVVGFSVWTQHRGTTVHEEPPGAAAQPPKATAHATAHGAPPEVKAPPTPGSPSWWRDPIVKDGTTGPVGPGYLWGPADQSLDEGAPRRFRAATADASRVRRGAPETRGPRSIGGLVFLLALVAGGLGTGLSWDTHPLGTSLQLGLAAALAVFGLGLLVASVVGRTGFGTVMLAVITAGLLAGASAVPKEIGTDWVREEWRPASVATVQPRYELGTGVARLDLSHLDVPVGDTVRTGVEVGAGAARVVVPNGVTVRVVAEAGLGDIRLFTAAPDGVRLATDLRTRRTFGPLEDSKPAGTVVLDLEVGIGQVEVTRATS
ncbi:phage shock protein C (PspC) family protein [Streptomyces sp. BpilaLS-43]|uniref:PspC domain-containing protein n=1 Tax=Streptomyces sp. BpilaLS-43 TaxID=1839778 RepID=UPI00081B8D3B|nr:PspC domain-containing protein [Streptomyces sp. BpilaLS-43]SCD75669.1 phage shock protein C (PspC) family protein [Streptomyces sp. BpilaLS-43]